MINMLVYFQLQKTKYNSLYNLKKEPTHALVCMNVSSTSGWQ